MVRRFLLILLFSCGLLVASCSDIQVVQLAQSTIDEAVANVQSSSNWNIALAEVDVGYRTGVITQGAIVLHNGSEFDRLVNLTYVPFGKVTTRLGSTYEISPSEAAQWVHIETPLVRLVPSETRVVAVALSVPKDTVLPDKWGFSIKAEGTGIVSCTMEAEIRTDVTTKDSKGNIVPDDFLKATLASSLLSNSLDAVKSVTSSIEEPIHVVSYDPSLRVLRLEGLKPSMTRTVTIEYEYGQTVVIAYCQNWYITMKRDNLLGLGQ